MKNIKNDEQNSFDKTPFSDAPANQHDAQKSKGTKEANV